MTGQRQDERVESEDSLFRRWPIGVDSWLRMGVAYLVLVLAGLGLGTLMTGPLARTALGRLDTDVSLWLEANRSPFWDTSSRFGDSFADTFVVVGALIVLVVAMAWFWRRWREPLVLGFGLVLEASVFLTVSLIVGRERPPVEQLDISPATASFPSGHTGAAFTFYGLLATIVFWNTRRLLPRVLAAALAVTIPVSVAVARLYRGMHYLSDVVVGASLGIACIVAAVTIVDRAIESSQPIGKS
ncbi:hypothetical protein BH23ACT4_BH23ACT4_06450 [soil metagenome]